MSQFETCSVYKLYIVFGVTAWAFTSVALGGRSSIVYSLSQQKTAKKISFEKDFFKKYLLKFEILLWLYNELSGRSNA